MYKIIGADLQEYGPVSAEEIRQWVAEGRANGQTLVQMIGEAGWRQLASFPELAPFLATAPSPGVPPGSFAGATTQLAPSVAEVLAGDYEINISSCITRGWELVKSRFLPLVGVSFLVWLAVGVIGQIVGLIYEVPMQNLITKHEITVSGACLIALGTIIMLPIQYVFLGGLYNFYLKMIRGEDSSIADAFSGFTASFGQLALLGLVLGTLTYIGTLLCIVPGIYLSVAWIFALPLMVDKKMGFWEAMETSRKVVTKHWFMVFALLVVLALVGISGLLACCVGAFVTGTIGAVALVIAYEDIFNRRTP